MRFAAAVLLVAALGVPSVSSAQGKPPGFRSPTTDELAHTTSGGAEWITYGGALNNERYSTLDQINTTNVQNLKGAWMTRLNSGRGAKYRLEADPLVIDGTMYIPTGNDDVLCHRCPHRQEAVGVG